MGTSEDDVKFCKNKICGKALILIQDDVENRICIRCIRDTKAHKSEGDKE